MTPLDQAFASAMQDDEKRSAFYSLFLNTELFIPVYEIPEEDGASTIGENDTISPLILEYEDERYVMLFDTQEKLQNWVQDGVDFEIGVVGLPGHAIAEMMSTDLNWALNVNTEFSKTFVKEEIELLKDFIAQLGGDMSLPAGTEVLVGAPAEIPVGLIDALTEKLQQNKEHITRAWLGQVHYVQDGEVPHLALVLEIAGLEHAEIRAIFDDLTKTAQPFLTSPDYMDIMVAGDSDLAGGIMNAVDHFYSVKAI